MGIISWSPPPRGRNLFPKTASNLLNEEPIQSPMKLAKIPILALAFAALPLAASAGIDIGINIGGPEIVVRTQPPPERIEVVPMSPGPGFIWIRGHWSWRHERWEWINGHWDRVANPGYSWVPGQWVARGNGWVWVEGHYVTAAPPPRRPPASRSRSSPRRRHPR